VILSVKLDNAERMTKQQVYDLFLSGHGFTLQGGGKINKTTAEEKDGDSFILVTFNKADKMMIRRRDNRWGFN
jgi:hypothetical protein